MKLDNFTKGIILLIPVALVISYFVFKECWEYHTNLGAGFWAALGACT